VPTHHLLDGVKHAGADSPILVTGSALVYRPSAGRFRGLADRATSPYGVSKLARRCSRSAAPVHGCRAAFNHAGPRQTTDLSSAFARQIAE
jgi:hypothetical protein